MTRSIVPRSNNEGGIGTVAKKWANVWAVLVNALTITAQTVGFTISGGTTSKTLTVSGDATVSGTNTGDKDIVDDTTPQLGGTLDMNEKSFEHEFGTLASDVQASGNIITATAGENVAFGNVCYFKSDGKFWKTDADAEATSKGLLVMAIASISANAAGLFLKSGFARNDAWNWTAGAELFLDTATAGGLTATKPSGTLDIVRLAGWAKAADYVEFNPSSIYLEIA
jgi:hypothetical protein